jgi:1-pyrroline-5-carboxylate dehydrogenase
MHKVFVVEMGGKNPAIVSKYADIDTAVSGVVSAAFGYSGQKCSALSRVYVQRQIKEEFISRLIDRTRKLSIGNPLVKGNYVGPLISESAYKRYAEAVEIAKRSGRVLYGGNRVRSVERGFYVEPSVVEVGSDNELMRRELFAPILAITSYEDIQDALRMANDTEYGLCAALYSKNRKEIRYFSDTIDAGVVYINRESSATTGAIVGRHTFVGWKWSGTSGKGTGSRFYLEQFMREQSLSLAAE